MMIKKIYGIQDYLKRPHHHKLCPKWVSTEYVYNSKRRMSLSGIDYRKSFLVSPLVRVFG